MNNISKLAQIKGQYNETVGVLGKVKDKSYYCATITLFRTYNDYYSAFLSTGLAENNTNKHYGVSNGKHNQYLAIKAAIKDAGITRNYIVNADTLDDVLIDIARSFNPQMTDFTYYVTND